MGLFSRDRSDTRGLGDENSPVGSGVGYAPVPADARDSGSAEIPDSFPYNLVSNYEAGVSPAIANRPYDPLGEMPMGDTRALGDAQAPHGSGAQSGSPELDYLRPRLVGQRRVDFGPLDGGLSDPIRDGNTPARPAVTRYQFIREAMQPDIRGEFARPDREIVGSLSRGAAQPRGRMSPMDEYRLLGDGTHA